MNPPSHCRWYRQDSRRAATQEQSGSRQRWPSWTGPCAPKVQAHDSLPSSWSWIRIYPTLYVSAINTYFVEDCYIFHYVPPVCEDRANLICYSNKISTSILGELFFSKNVFMIFREIFSTKSMRACPIWFREFVPWFSIMVSPAIFP